MSLQKEGRKVILKNEIQLMKNARSVKRARFIVVSWE